MTKPRNFTPIDAPLPESSSSLLTVSASTDDSTSSDPEAMLLDTLLADFNAGRSEVPLFPPSAKRMLALARIDEPDESDLARVIETDAPLATLIVRTSGGSSVRSATESLGSSRVCETLKARAMRNVRMLRSAWVRERVNEAYRHGMEVAAYTSVLARMLQKFDPHKALLCGLLHEIGVFTVLAAADTHWSKMRHLESPETVVGRLGDMMGPRLLSRWKMDPDLIRCAEAMDDWHRDPAPRPDYADLVLVAKLHCFIGTPRAKELPDLASLPAFRKIAGKEASPRFGIWLKRSGEKRLREMEQARDQLLCP